MVRTITRRRLLAAALTGGAPAVAGCSVELPFAGGQEPAGPRIATVSLEPLATGLSAPVAVSFVPDTDIHYVASQAGRVHVLGPDGLRDEPLLDLRGVVETGGEKGLLGIALHPDFGENRRLFVRYSAPRRSGTPSNYSHTFVLSEFLANDEADGVRLDSERTVLEIPQPQSNHNAGDIAFGPDGYLYVTVGDGGGADDRGRGHVDDWYESVEGGNGQDVSENLLGSILRIDVDDREGGRGYAIPDDNPLVDREGLDEHFAWGLRNPWRLSFDGDDLYVADAGQDRYEEVNLVERGGNYGWNVREGTHCFAADDCPDRTPEDVRGGEALVDPIIEYSHDDGPVTGISVIGGYVYRGASIPALSGAYVFGDLRADGRLLAATPPAEEGLWPIEIIEIASGDRDAIGRLYSFGRDRSGEMYVLGTGADGGGLYRIVPGE